jgi:hypothetical protein
MSGPRPAVPGLASCMFQIIFIHFDLMFEWSGNYCVLI